MFLFGSFYINIMKFLSYRDTFIFGAFYTETPRAYFHREKEELGFKDR